MENRSRIPVSVFLAITLACTVGCSSQENAEQQSGAQGAGAVSKDDKNTSTESTPLQKAEMAYREALSTPKKYFDLKNDLGLKLEGNPTAKYSYALVNLKGEDIPRLLVHAVVHDSSLGVAEGTRVLSYDPNTGNVTVADHPLKGGVASAGGYRANVGYSAFGDGFLRIRTFSAGRDEALLRDTVTNDSIQEKVVYSIRKDDFYQDVESTVKPLHTLRDKEFRNIEWTDITDLSTLDKLKNNAWKNTVEQEGADPSALAQELGFTIYNGILRFVSQKELLQLQQKPDPNLGYEDVSQPYAILDLGGKQTATMHAVGSKGRMEQRQLSMISLATRAEDEWRSLNGQHVTVAVDHDSCWFPSDTGLPLGEPRCDAYAILPAK